MIQMNLFTKQKQNHRLRELTYGYQAGKGGGGIVREFGMDVHTAIFKMDNNKVYCIAQGTLLNIMW